MDDAIKNFMTHGVHTIAAERTLSEAHEMMEKHRIRHLPVLRDGKLQGLVTQRDLSMVESFRLADPRRVKVTDAMSEDVFTVEAEAPLAEVSHRMARDKLGSAVVMREGRVIGIFTGVDALAALDFLLTSPTVKRALHEAMIPATKAAPS